MKAGDRVFALIRREESLALKAYLKAGDRWTIGWGHTATTVEGLEITQLGAERLLVADVRDAERFADAFLTKPVPAVTQGQYDAIVDFIFNFGPTKFGKSDFYKHIRAGDWKLAALELPRWVHAYDRSVQGGLVRRRSVDMYWFMEPIA